MLIALLMGCSTLNASEEFTWPDLKELKPIDDIRPVPADIWQRRAISYSGYREGQSPKLEIYPGDEEVLEDLRILIENGFGLIRVYNSVGHGEQVIRIIDENDLDLKVQAGAYISQSFEKNGEFNAREVARVVELANQYPDIVMGVSIGNEILVSWSFVAVPPQEAIGYIRWVRDRIRQPVTVNDNWEPYAAGPDNPVSKVWGQVDYAAVHTYAYWDSGFEKWDFRQPDDAALIAAAFDYARENFREARKALDAADIQIPIVIGETGWQNLPSARENSALVPNFAELIAGPERQQIYYRAMQKWAYGDNWDTPGDGFSRPASMFYFAAFDEPWKGQDDNWGIWDALRKLKWDPALDAR
jgi:exo-beta-1,3-glucanase (GH17 family)